VQDLEASINAVDCDGVVLGTPADLRARMRISKPTVRVRFEGRDAGEPWFSQYLDKIFVKIKAKRS
jgi:predicted GTPase